MKFYGGNRNSRTEVLAQQIWKENNLEEEKVDNKA